MKTIKIIALFLATAAMISCGGNARNQNNQSSSQKPSKKVSIEEEVITKAWQASAAANFLEQYTLVHIGMEGMVFNIVDDANEHDIDLGDYEDHANAVLKKLDEFAPKFADRLRSSDPGAVYESHPEDNGDLMQKLIGTPDAPANPSDEALEAILEDIMNYAANLTAKPVVRTKELDEDSDANIYTFENVSAIVEEKGGKITVNVPNWDDVHAFLSTVYPNSVDESLIPDFEQITTARFREYAREECDYDPIYCTQDCYAYDILPNPIITAYGIWPNAYKVSWDRYEDAQQVENTVVLTMKDGKYLIDNILELEDGNPHLLFDYSKPAVSIWAE